MKKLIRSKNNKVIGGVAAGLGEYFDIDPLLIRILLVAGFFSPVPVVLLYLVSWIIIPREKILLTA